VIARLLASLVAAIAALVLAAGAAPDVRAAACPPPVGYPGDDASREAIAAWMADRARGRGIPPELPVMAALVDSGLRNLNVGDSDAVGYFQMRTAIWDKGEYAGFPGNPELQIEWFLDQAEIVRDQRLGSGLGIGEQSYGEWVADVQRPAEQYRGRYQLRLGEARALIGPAPPPCGEEPQEPQEPAPGLDETPPRLRLNGAGVQPAVARGAVLVVAGCGTEGCSLSARGTVRVPSPGRGARPARTKTFRIAAGTVRVAAGKSVTLRLRLGTRVRRAARRALRRGARLRANIEVTAKDTSGNAVVARRSVRLRR
jgi:hypothetical protein